MSEKLLLLDEPNLEFRGGQRTVDPHDGLSLFGSYAESAQDRSTHVVIGTPAGLDKWASWRERMNRPASCRDISRLRAWPPFPGFDVAFDSPWPKPLRNFSVDEDVIDQAARRSDKYERANGTVECYLQHFTQMQKLDATPVVAVCIVPDSVYLNCRPESYVADKSDAPRTTVEKSELRRALKDKRSGQKGLAFGDDEGPAIDLMPFDYSPDFRRQLKAKVMPHGIPVQIVKQSTLDVTKEIEDGEPGNNPLSDRLFNLGTGLAYKCGQKPWKLSSTRDGVCYVGLAFRQSDDKKRDACCAAQLFLDSGDGVVFVGEFGPWYSPDDEQFHLTPKAAESLLRGTIETYQTQGGQPLKEIFLHSHSAISESEYEGYLKAVPPGCRLIAVRVRQDRNGPRLFRDGDRPPLRGLFWQRTERYGLLYSTGFVPRLGTYEGFETPVPLSISLQHGDADIVQIARDILGLTKLNYNACTFGEAEPITIKYSKRIGEILLANRGLAPEHRQHTFRYYV
jgi:hypothetical protein